MVLTKSIDPENVSAALEGLTMATVAVLATLKVRFAKAITLGTAIGNVFDQIFSPFTSKVLQYGLPDDYEKWIPVCYILCFLKNRSQQVVLKYLTKSNNDRWAQVINRYGFRYIGLCTSWILMRMMTSVFAALRGSSLFITGVCGYLVKHNHVEANIFKQGNIVLVGGWGILAAVGVYVQMSNRFSLSFPLNILLMPFTIAENAVIFAVGASSD